MVEGISINRENFFQSVRWNWERSNWRK